MNDPELSKEAVLHAQRDMRNVRPARSVEEAVIAHARRDTAALAPTPPEPTERGFFGKLADRIGRAWDDLRIGDEHAIGMVKLGADELTQALVALPDSTIRPLEEPGVFGNEHMPHIQHHDHDSRGHDHDRTRDR